jgi:hypothetical protein
MKKILMVAAAFLFILVLTYMANHANVDQPTGYSFSLKAQRVVMCSANEIVLVDPHQKSTRLEKDSSWPDCSTFKPNEFDDFDLARGSKTIFKKREQTAWWRKAM